MLLSIFLNSVQWTRSLIVYYSQWLLVIFSEYYSMTPFKRVSIQEILLYMKIKKWKQISELPLFLNAREAVETKFEFYQKNSVEYLKDILLRARISEEWKKILF